MLVGGADLSDVCEKAGCPRADDLLRDGMLIELETANSELPISVNPPAPGRAIGLKSQTELIASCNSDDARERPGPRRADDLHRSAAGKPAIGGIVPQIAVGVVAPSPDGTVRL